MIKEALIHSIQRRGKRVLCYHVIISISLPFDLNKQPLIGDVSAKVYPTNLYLGIFSEHCHDAISTETAIAIVGTNG
jgi:hypothetical protein